MLNEFNIRMAMRVCKIIKLRIDQKNLNNLNDKEKDSENKLNFETLCNNLYHQNLRKRAVKGS